MTSRILQTVQSHSSRHGANALLATIFLLLAPAFSLADEPQMKRIELSVEKPLMQPNEQQALDIQVLTMDGQTLGLAELPRRQVRILSLNPEIATTNSSGKVFARGHGAATLQVEVTLGGETLTAHQRIGVPVRPLDEADFIMDGPYGSYGSTVEQIGENHFVMTRGTHPEDPGRLSLPQLIIPSNFKGNHLVLDIESLGMPHEGHNYYLAYSQDGEHWTPLLQKVIDETVSRIEIPPTNTDSFYLGFQIPLSHETAQRFFHRWASDPRVSQYVTLHHIGHSVQGRPLYRMEVTDPDSPYPREERWAHYISQAHPHEGKSRWRVKGMADWVLSEEAADARSRHIWHFVLTMNPDGVNNGFTRLNVEGVDMNRTYLVDGANRDEQALEAYLYQRDIAQLMESETPLTTFWDMHVWPRRVEPLMHFGPEFGDGNGELGDWTELRDLIESYDEHDLIQPLAERRFSGNDTLWDRGIHHRYGITSSLVEGSGFVDTQEENIEAGRILARGIADFYQGTRSNPGQ